MLFGKKIIDRSIRVKTNTNYDRLPIPGGIRSYEGRILFCFFSENTYTSPPSIRVKDDADKCGLLIDIELKVVGITPTGDAVTFDATFDNVTDCFTCNTSGKYKSDTNLLVCHDGNRAIPLADYFTNNPLLFKTADDTVYHGQEVLQGNTELEKYDQNRIIGLDWTAMGVDISIEFSKEPVEKLTIQDALRKHLEHDPNLTHIVFDHGTGEIADYITFKAEGSFIKVGLYHCKAMKGVNYNSAVADVYEVAQQAIKSTVWVKSKSLLLNKIQARIKGGTTKKFVRGDFRTLKALLQSQKALEVTIYIVQPAISKSERMADTVGEVLSSATSYIRHTGRVKELKVLGSK